MEFTCSKADLLASVQVVSRAVPSSTVEQALLNVLLNLTEEGDGLLTLFATDNRISLRHSMPVQRIKPGRVAIAGQLLLEVLQGLQTSRSDEVRLTLSPENRVMLTSADAVYNIAGFAPESFPLLPTLEVRTQFTISSTLLKEMIRKIIVVSSSSGGGLQAYEEVLVEGKGGELCFVATDSVRLAIRSAQVGSKDLPDFHCLVPSHALTELGRVLKGDHPVEVTLSDDQVSFSFGPSEMRTRLSDKTFPNFRTILPKVQSRNLVLRTREFQDNLRGVIPLAKDTKHKVFIEFEKEKVIITCTSPELGEARREVESALTGEPIRLAFNGKYLLDFLSVVDSDSFRWGVSSPSYPATLAPDVEDAGYTYILMPITHY
jgi:DNA polymerase-3 subunit beta